MSAFWLLLGIACLVIAFLTPQGTDRHVALVMSAIWFVGSVLLDEIREAKENRHK